MRLTAGEREQYERDGYVVRPSVFSVAEVAALRDIVEEVAGGVRQRAYWFVTILSDAADVATVVLFLDDSYASNGALRVLPGSHRLGPALRDPQDPTRFLADPRRLDTSGEVTVEVPAGSLLMFGAFLVHRSSPNATGGDRWALLLSYQPAGRPRLEEGTFRPELVEQLP